MEKKRGLAVFSCGSISGVEWGLLDAHKLRRLKKKLEKEKSELSEK